MWPKIKAWWQSLSINKTGPDVKPPEMGPATPFVIPSYGVNSKRQLRSQLEKIIDAEIMRTNSTKFKHALSLGDANTIVGLAAEALSSLKVREKSGSNDGPMVELIQATTGNGRGDAWCMSASQTCVAYAEKKTGKVSKLYESASCASVRANSSSLAVAAKDSQYGDLWVFVYLTGLGHVGIFEGWIKYMVSAVLNESNTTAGKVGDVVVREGGGSYQTERELITDTKAKMRLGMVIRAF